MRLLLQASIVWLSLSLCFGLESSPAQGPKNDSLTPFWSCCPPGSLLAIVDTWNTDFNLTGQRGEGRHHEDVAGMITDLGSAYFSKEPRQDILEVSCVPDLHNSPALETYRGSSEMEEDQVLLWSGQWLPTCPGGVKQLSTTFIGEAPRWGDSGRMRNWRMTRSGSLTVEGGKPSYSQDRQFCLTWTGNPREQLYLEAVFCDPCKSKVMCHLLSTIAWPYLKDKLEAVREKHRTEFVFQLSPFIEHMMGPKPWKMPPLRELMSTSCRHHHSGAKCEQDWFKVVVPYLNLGDRVNVTKEEFTSGSLSPIILVKEVFHGLDVDQDSFVTLEEATPESLLSHKFLHGLASMIFKLVDFNQDNFLTSDDDPDLSLENLKTYFYGLYSALDKNRDYRIDLTEFLDLLLSLHKFFTSSDSSTCPHTLPSSSRELAAAQCRVSMTSFLTGLDKAGVTRNMQETLRQLILPYISFSRAVLQSLVRSADSDSDGRMSWQELEDFSDFSLALQVWPGMLELVLQGQGRADREAWATVVSHLGDTSTLLKINNILYSKDFQFGQSKPPCDM